MSILKPSQADAVQGVCKAHANQNNLVMIEAPPGYGKTFTVAHVIKALGMKQGDVAFSTPTHAANAVLAGELRSEATVKTIYSLLGLRLTTDSKEQEVKAMSKINLSDYRAMVIDEISALGRVVFDRVIEAAQQYPKLLIILLGDRYQARPVNDEFSPFWELSKTIPYFVLTEPVRMHKDSPALATSMELRELIDINYREPINFEAETSEHGNIEIVNIKDFNNRIKDYFTHDKFEYTDGIITAFHNARVVSASNIVRNIVYGKNPRKFYEGEGFYALNGVGYDKETFLHNNQKIIIDRIEDANTFNPYSDSTLEYVSCYKLRVRDVSTGEIVVVYAPNEQGDSAYDLNVSRLRRAAIDSSSRFAWRAYYEYIKNYANLRSMYSTTLHKVQGSSYDDTVFVDAVDLQFPKNNAELAVDYLNLLLVGITRSRQHVVIAQRD